MTRRELIKTLGGNPDNPVSMSPKIRKLLNSGWLKKIPVGMERYYILAVPGKDRT